MLECTISWVLTGQYFATATSPVPCFIGMFVMWIRDGIIFNEKLLCRAPNLALSYAKDSLCCKEANGLELFIESFPQRCIEGKWLQNRLQADKNELRSILAVDIQGDQRGGFCIVPNGLK